jgi:hypothetical protein
MARRTIPAPPVVNYSVTRCRASVKPKHTTRIGHPQRCLAKECASFFSSCRWWDVGGGQHVVLCRLKSLQVLTGQSDMSIWMQRSGEPILSDCGLNLRQWPESYAAERIRGPLRHARIADDLNRYFSDRFAQCRYGGTATSHIRRAH